ncbi:MAG: iron ABC transporter permease [Rhodospirillales bacterium]|nr:iron ABC transporter permease [Rhodospirillales bacterium]
MQRILSVFSTGRLSPARLSISPLLPFALLPMVGLIAIVVVFLWVSVQTGVLGTPETVYSLENYRTLFGDSFVLEVLENTLVFAVVTTFVALVIGLPIAWITERTTIRPKELIYAMMTTGLLVPPVFIGMGWTFIAHERIGFVNKILIAMFDLKTGPINIETLSGMGLIEGLTLAPLAFVLNVQVFRTMNPALEEAAQTSGMSFPRTLWRVTLPLARPAILATLIYIFVIGLATFDIPAVIGMSSNIFVFSTFVFTEAFPPDGLPEYGIPAALGTVMVFVAVALTLWYVQMLRRSQRYQVVSGKGYKARQIDAGKWVYACWAFICIYFFIGLLLPILLVSYEAFLPYVAAPTVESLSLLTMLNFEQMNWEYVMRGLKNTVILMVVVPPVILALAFCVSWLVVRSKTKARYILEFGAFLPHTIPRVVMSIGALLLALFVLRNYVPIYGTVWILVAIYVIVWLPFGTRALNSAMIQIHKELEEAAYISGLTMVRTVRRVMIPLLRPTMLSVWIWTGLLVYREMTVAVFLISQDNVTLPAIVWGRWTMGSPNAAAAITVLMMAALLPLMLISWRFARRSTMSTDT